MEEFNHMRKILLGTTAAIGAAALALPAYAQGAPSVRIGGYYVFQYGNVGERGTTTPTERHGRNSFRSDAEVHVIVTGKAANGISYGATIEFEMDNNGTTTRNLFGPDEQYIFVSSPTLGQLRAGDEDGAVSLMQVQPPTNFGTGGVNGNFDDYLIGPAGNGLGTAVPVSWDFAEIGDNSKIIYLSPQFFGFDVGLSYALNTGSGETTGGGTNGAGVMGGNDRSLATGAPSATARRNEFQLAARWRGNFGGVGVAVGAGAFLSGMQKARAASVETKTREDIKAYNLGLNVSFGGLTVGATYVWGQYGGAGNPFAALNTNDPGRRSARIIGAGVSYRMGAFTVGANFWDGRKEGRPQATNPDDQKTRAFAIGGTWNMAPGLDLIAEFVNYRHTDDPTAAQVAAGAPTKNSGNVFIIGTRLAW